MEIVTAMTKVKINFMSQQETMWICEKVSLEEYSTVKFWKDLKGLIQDIPQGKNVFLGGDLNGNVRSV
ncbi:hypothetical protein MTR_6g052730 [Medicago truncatula]|uniref:Uncharacterized protein n=1 Tax=Medicago truncatula TaxID=3880 RepID=G7KLI6_MEDTR|nr:hypothetical protein MTR_6g052730 [Medicago truncatula]